MRRIDQDNCVAQTSFFSHGQALKVSAAENFKKKKILKPFGSLTACIGSSELFSSLSVGSDQSLFFICTLTGHV